jgi:hypothetical protein
MLPTGTQLVDVSQRWLDRFGLADAVFCPE